MNKHEDLSLEDLQILAASKAKQAFADKEIVANADVANNRAMDFTKAAIDELIAIKDSKGLQKAQTLTKRITTHVGGEVAWWETQLITTFIETVLNASKLELSEGEEKLLKFTMIGTFIKELRDLNKKLDYKETGTEDETIK